MSELHGQCFKDFLQCTFIWEPTFQALIIKQVYPNSDNGQQVQFLTIFELYKEAYHFPQKTIPLLNPLIDLTVTNGTLLLCLTWVRNTPAHSWRGSAILAHLTCYLFRCPPHSEKNCVQQGIPSNVSGLFLFRHLCPCADMWGKASDQLWGDHCSLSVPGASLCQEPHGGEGSSPCYGTALLRKWAPWLSLSSETFRHPLRGFWAQGRDQSLATDRRGCGGSATWPCPGRPGTTGLLQHSSSSCHLYLFTTSLPQLAGGSLRMRPGPHM